MRLVVVVATIGAIAVGIARLEGVGRVFATLITIVVVEAVVGRGRASLLIVLLRRLIRGSLSSLSSLSLLNKGLEEKARGDREGEEQVVRAVVVRVA